jgi:hypothetical protein
MPLREKSSLKRIVEIMVRWRRNHLCDPALGENAGPRRKPFLQIPQLAFFIFQISLWITVKISLYNDRSHSETTTNNGRTKDHAHVARTAQKHPIGRFLTFETSLADAR